MTALLRHSWCLLTLPLLLGACGAESTPRTTLTGNASLQPVADIQQVMLHVIEPAADAYWDAVGWIIDASGETAIEPQDEEEWEAVLNAAYMIAESGNLLMMDGRRLDDGAWVALSQSLVEVGKQAIAAAESENKLAVFDAGAEVYAACTACHSVYATQTLRPSATER